MNDYVVTNSLAWPLKQLYYYVQVTDYESEPQNI